MRSSQITAEARRSAYSSPVDGRYEVRLAQTTAEVAGALRLRHRVFSVELGGDRDQAGAVEFDQFDSKARHLIVVCRETQRVVGTYRLLTVETVGHRSGFYSAGEFTTEDLPAEVLEDGIEIGRACIDKDHRSTKVLFLLWKGLLEFMAASRKRFFFGCCSMFTRDERAGAAAYKALMPHLSDRYSVLPRRDAVDTTEHDQTFVPQLPSLFEMYLRLGAEVSGPPMIDRDFGTIDFFVVFDVERMTDKYRRMFAR